jgi:hypothetical protein
VIYCLYAKASFANATRRNNAFAIVTNWLARPEVTANLFVDPEIASVDDWGYKGWPNALTCTVRCRTQSLRDDLWTQLIAGMTGTGAPNLGYAEHWDQMLDAPNPDADTTRYNFASQSWP